MLENYPTFIKFGVKFGKSAVTQYATRDNLNLCVNGNFCSLINIANIYGKGTPQAWLLVQLTGLAEALGLQDKVTSYQLTDIAELLYDDYRWLKYTEFLQAFRYLRRIDYYGRFDTSTILNGMKQWNNSVRVPTIERYEQAEREKQEAEWKRRAVPMPESSKRKVQELWQKLKSRMIN